MAEGLGRRPYLPVAASPVDEPCLVAVDKRHLTLIWLLAQAYHVGCVSSCPKGPTDFRGLAESQASAQHQTPSCCSRRRDDFSIGLESEGCRRMGRFVVLQSPPVECHMM